MCRVTRSVVLLVAFLLGCRDGVLLGGEDPSADVDAPIGDAGPIPFSEAGADAAGDLGGDPLSDAATPADSTVPGDSSSPSITVQPVEISDLLANPGMGWQTFHRVATADSTLAGLPSGSAYYRWSWKQLEPTKGNYNIALIKNTLASARAAGQTLQFRVMIAGADESYAPTWLSSAGCKTFSYQYHGGPWMETPDFDDATCYALHAALITELGKQLAADLDIEVDIGSVGIWGEWHFSSTSPQVPFPSLATRKKIVDLYFTAFPKVPLLALIGETDTLAYAVSKGAGWRADCLGDWGFWGSTWNHMDNMYKQNLTKANANDAWKVGPVAWESCGTMTDWVSAGFDVQKTLQYALDLHGSFLNNKSQPLPAGQQYRQAIEDFLRKLGYRFVLRKLTHPQTLVRGKPGKVEMSWENVGVAPGYAAHALAFRLSPSGGGQPAVFVTKQTVRAWLPGTFQLSETLTADSSLQPGSYSLAVGIVDASGKPVVRLAIAGGETSKWYPVSTVNVQ